MAYLPISSGDPVPASTEDRDSGPGDEEIDDDTELDDEEADAELDDLDEEPAAIPKRPSKRPAGEEAIIVSIEETEDLVDAEELDDSSEDLPVSSLLDDDEDDEPAADAESASPAADETDEMTPMPGGRTRVRGRSQAGQAGHAKASRSEASPADATAGQTTSCRGQGQGSGQAEVQGTGSEEVKAPCRQERQGREGQAEQGQGDHRQGCEGQGKGQVHEVRQVQVGEEGPQEGQASKEGRQARPPLRAKQGRSAPLPPWGSRRWLGRMRHAGARELENQPMLLRCDWLHAQAAVLQQHHGPGSSGMPRSSLSGSTRGKVAKVGDIDHLPTRRLRGRLWHQK